MLFADLRTSGGAFGTLDYSENPPLLFLGEWVEFDDLHLKNLRQFEGWSVHVHASGSSAGRQSRIALLPQLRRAGRASRLRHTLTAVCPQCLSVLDTSTPAVQDPPAIQGSRAQSSRMIPLGTRGKIRRHDGRSHRVSDSQRCTMPTTATRWDEYLLFNPYKGFRYLTEYHGHWNFVARSSGAARARRARGRRRDVLDGKRISSIFDPMRPPPLSCSANFHGASRWARRSLCDDFVDPPYVLSSETTGDEVTWSRGEYIPGARNLESVRAAGQRRRPRAAFSQPAVALRRQSRRLLARFRLVAAASLIGLAIFFAVFSRNATVFQQDPIASRPRIKAKPRFVTPVFDLDRPHRRARTERPHQPRQQLGLLQFRADQRGHRPGLRFRPRGQLLSRLDSDGPGPKAAATTSVIPSVPAGPLLSARRARNGSAEPRVSRVPAIGLRVDPAPRRAQLYFFWIAALLLLIPPIFHTMRSRSFEAEALDGERLSAHLARGGD